MSSRGPFPPKTFYDSIISTIDTSKPSSTASSEGKSLPPINLPASDLPPLGGHWRGFGRLLARSCGPSPPKHLACQKRGGIKELWIAGPARGERGDESPAALLEPCSSFDADRRVSFMRAMPCNRNHSGTFCFLPSAGRHKTARSTRPRVRASTCIAYSLFSLEGEPEEHPERGLGPGGCPEQSQPGVVQSSARRARGKQAPRWE